MSTECWDQQMHALTLCMCAISVYLCCGMTSATTLHKRTAQA